MMKVAIIRQESWETTAGEAGWIAAECDDGKAAPKIDLYL